MEIGFRTRIVQLISEERAKRIPLQKQIDDIDKRIAALELTMRIEDERMPIKNRGLFDVSPEELKENAKTIPSALEYLARRSENGKKVQYREARDIIIAAGLAKGKPKNAGSHIYNIMSNSSRWIKLGEGYFELAIDKTINVPSIT